MICKPAKGDSMSFGITYTRCRPTPGSWTLYRGQLLSDTKTTTHRRGAEIDGLRANRTFPKNFLGSATGHFATEGHDLLLFLKKSHKIPNSSD